MRASPAGSLYEQFLKFAPDAIVGVDSHGRIACMNAQAETLFGYRHEDLVGERIEELVPGESVRAAHSSERGGGGPMGAELDLLGKRKDGSLFPVEISVSSVETDDGMIANAAIRDVSRRVRAQRRFVQFLEFAPDAIVGITPGGLIELVNAQTELLFGYSRQELVGQCVEILVPDRFRADHSSHRDGYFADPVTRRMGGAALTLFGRRKDGSEFPAEISLSSIDVEHEMLGIAAIRDVSERIDAERDRKRLEVQLDRTRRDQDLRERNALEEQLNQLRRLDSVGQLAGGIAHDFNNILGVILNSAEFVADDLDDDSPMLEDVEEIRRSAQRAAALTRQLLIFSRRDVVRPQSLNLNDVVSELERLLTRVLGEHVLLETRFDPGLWPVMADPGQIEQVLVNLAVNARDAMPGGGRLIIETTNVDLDEQYGAMEPPSPTGPHVRLAVSDTGTGMDREVAAKAFVPFFTTKPKGEGTGLGLATVYGIVVDAGGNVKIYSELGLGTTVKVQLPATRTAPKSPVEQRPTVRPSRGETLLVVEDEASLRRVTHRILVKGGYKVLVATKGDEALEICARPDTVIDLLLTDVIMPGMLGPELATRATKLRPGLPVLFMSGYADQLIGHTTDRGNEIPFVEKPFTATTLMQGVARVLGQTQP